MYNLLDELTYCLDEGFPAPITEALLRLATDRCATTLSQAFRAWDNDDRYVDDFIIAVEAVTDQQCALCDRCNRITFSDDMTATDDGDTVVCDRRCLDYYYSCDICSGIYTSTTTVNGYGYCDSCLRDRCTYCDECEQYYEDGEDHRHGCECDAPRRHFQFLANGHGTISDNERLDVELPKGTIDEEGMRLITRLLQQTITDPWCIASKVVEGVGPLWQAKRGNFTRRLSSAFHSDYGIKLDAGVLSEVGNLARAHSSDAAHWHVEFTRDLNESAEHFYHESSCWWSSHAVSRCCLKNWGGLAMRTFHEDASTYSPNGRVWVQPLNDDLEPTHDTIGAHAFIVYNGYGDLEGYVAARLIAHLTSRSYRRISFEANNMYVNGTTGYLIADEATCEATDSIYFDLDPHDKHDAANYQKVAA